MWQPGQPISIDAPLLVPTAHMGAALAALAAAGGPSPAVVEVLPNGQPRWQLIDLLTQLQTAGVRSQDSPHRWRWLLRVPLSPRLPAYVRELGMACGLLLDAIEAMDPVAIEHQCDQVDRRRLEWEAVSSNSAPPRLEEIVEFIRQLTQRLIRPFEQAAAYHHPNSNSAHRNWWKSFPTLRTACGELVSQFQSTFSRSPPEELKEMGVWLDKLFKLLTLLRKETGQSEPSVLKQASAFCTARADAALRAGHAGLALLYLHRGVDWLLTAKCADAGHIVFNTYGGRYTHDSSTPISFASSLSLLSQQPLHGLEAHFKELNAWRNLAIHTHHMTLIPNGEAEALYLKIRPKLKHLADTAWDQACSDYGLPPPLTLLSLLDADGTVRSAFTVT